MAASELDLASLRPKGHLRLRLMFEGVWKWLTLIGVIFALVGVASIPLAAFFISLEKRYEREGKTVTGTVEDKDTYTTTTTHDSDGHRHTTTTTHYRVYYKFTAADGTSYQGKGDLSRGEWERLQPGSPIEVQYLPGKPTENRPFAARQGGAVWFFVIFPIAFGGVGLILLAIPAHYAGRNARLLSQGVLTRGTVEEKTERHDITINNRHPFSISYHFQLATGESYSGKELVADLAFASKLVVGEPVGVIYLTTDPGRSTIFREKWMKYFQPTGT